MREWFTPLIVCFAVAAAAQDVGMGRRQGSGKRFEEPYTLNVQTPHVKWANPLPGGPIKLLAVPSVSEGRTLVELMQRLSLDVTSVTIDSAFDRNKWTMCFGRDYGARAERGDLSLIYSYLEQELASAKHFDTVLLQLNHGWEALTPKSREALLKRVREGAGLVLLRPMENELSPLAPAAAPAPPSRPYNEVEPPSAPAGEWKRVAEHYITRGIPVETFPFEYLEEYAYRPAPGATVLIESAAGRPIAATTSFGKGRIVAFGFQNHGLSWRMPMSAKGFVSDLQWEYYYAMLLRALIYTAGREPQVRFVPSHWRLKTADGVVKRSGTGRPPKSLGTIPGLYFLEQQSASDFEISAIKLGALDRVEQLQSDAGVIREAQTVNVTWSAEKPARVELTDGFGRVIARSQGANSTALKAGRPLTHSGFIVVTAGTGSARLPVQFAASSREWSDYEVIMPWYGPGSYQPWIPALDEQFRQFGLTTLARPDRNFKVIASAGLHDTFGVYAYRNQKYVARKNAYAETKDKKYLTRDVVLQSPDFERNLRRDLEKNLKPLAPLHPLAYYLADESSLTSYTDPFDVDWSPETLAAFRLWLQKEYSSLDALNASWETSFTRWGDVVPMTTEEVQKHGNFAPWTDHRVFMEQDFVRVLGRARDMVREVDPGALASISGTQVPTAHNGCNWYEIDQRMDYLQPYSGGNQDEMHHLFRPGIKLTGFTGYGSTGAAAHEQQWRRLFYGHTGASIFWHYTILNPDLSFSEQGRALSQAFGRIQRGIGRVFMNSRVLEDGVAIHFSMASIRGAWITDGRIRPGVGNVMGSSQAYADLFKRRGAWARQLESDGIQFRFLATPQIENGELDKFKVLILPYSIALSDREARAIEAFAERGGTVYIDEQTGRMDERGHWRKPQLWQGERKGFVRRAVGKIELKAQFEAPRGALVTVRQFGSSRLVGVLPEETARVKAPRTRKVTYDLLRGCKAAAEVGASAESPALFIERDTQIARLSIDSALNLQLVDEKGAPVDRSVVRAEVFDPAGNLVRHYSSNVDVVDGRGKFEISFALNDAAGNWKVRARDVISGLTAEQVVRR
ncbi:MAG: beta-galactosidase [Bryobacteraceae bacterium]|nr:beta-galactosidase [Bryobacterales bacterium]NUM99781.1 beta-galactosidase [Bryobacteraceae bacterium]